VLLGFSSGRTIPPHVAAAAAAIHAIKFIFLVHATAIFTACMAIFVFVFFVFLVVVLSSC